MYLNHSKTKMICILVFFNYHFILSSHCLWLCASTLGLRASRMDPSATHLVIILVYKLSHVVYAHSLHMKLLHYLWSRIPSWIHLPLPLSQRLGYPSPSRSSTTCVSRGSHDPLQCLSQAMSVVDVTLRPRSHRGVLIYGLHSHYQVSVVKFRTVYAPNQRGTKRTRAIPQECQVGIQSLYWNWRVPCQLLLWRRNIFPSWV